MNGLLGGFNPLMSLGAGLLSASGPSFEPVGVGQGLSRGLLMMQDAARQQQAAAERKAHADFLRRRDSREQQRFEFEQSQAQAAAEQAARRQQAMQGLLGHLPPDQQGTASQLLAADPKAGLDFVTGLLSPKQKDMPAQVQQYEFAKAQGYPGSFMDFLKASKSGVTVNVGGGSGGPAFRAPTAEDEAAAGLPPGTLTGAPGLLVDNKGKLDTVPMTEEQKLETKRKQAKVGMLEPLQEYQALVSDSLANDGVVEIFGEKADLMERARVTLARALARYEAGGQAEPNPEAVTSALERIPKAGGPIDRARFEKRMESLLRSLGVSGKARAKPSKKVGRFQVTVKD